MSLEWQGVSFPDSGIRYTPAAMLTELTTALDAVRQAAALCRTVQASIDVGVLEKNDRSPVTVADFASQAVICRALAEAFPDDPVVAEEESRALRHGEGEAILERVGSELKDAGIDAPGDVICDWIDRGVSEPGPRFWTLDPIDGTKGFLRGEQYAVALALLVDGQAEVAVLACPNLGETGGTVFSAVRGQGARAEPLEHSGTARSIQVSPCGDASDARFCESVESAHSSHDRSAQIVARLGNDASPVRLDSQAKYAVVAEGQAELYLRLPVDEDYREKIWDHAAGMLVVQEAGGTVTDVTGLPLDFTHGRTLAANRGILVTNGLLHQRVLEAIDGC